jgi:hypothetical protein
MPLYRLLVKVLSNFSKHYKHKKTLYLAKKPKKQTQLRPENYAQ